MVMILLQKTLPILSLFAIMFVGLVAPAMAENDEYWESTYHELEEEYDEQRWNLEEEFEEKYEELSRYYEEEKMAIYDKIDSDPSLSDDDIDKMFKDLFNEFEEKQEDLDEIFEKELYDLNRMYDEKFRQLDKEFEKYDDYDDYDKYEKYDDYDEPYLDDPEWKSIEPLTQKIMDAIPMEKIQSLWESEQIDELVELIVSETDLSHEDAKRVVLFFERYDDRDHDKYDYPEHDYYDYPEHDYYESNPTLYSDDQIVRLEQRIHELEEENQILRETIAELEDKISQINAVVMEQVKFIYEWVLSQ